MQMEYAIALKNETQQQSLLRLSYILGTSTLNDAKTGSR